MAQTKSRDTLGRRPCFISKQFIRAQTCFAAKPPEQIRRRGMLPVDQGPDGWLANTNTPCQRCLRGASPLDVLAKSFHMTRPSIAIGYFNAIGGSYSQIRHAFRMKRKQRTVLDRALEALAEKYPRERATQVRLAQLAGVRQPSVNSWGKPDEYPAMVTAVRLAEVLGVCVEWLLTERGPKHPPKASGSEAEAESFLREWDKLDPEIQRQIARYADFVKAEKTKQ